MSPKDVFYLGPSNNVYVVARFGAHKGDYMFHCHNLIHEDNDMLRAMRITGMWE
jgi:FtsP/CotA-like multicopper oxidase with cupredoxin domain